MTAKEKRISFSAVVVAAISMLMPDVCGVDPKQWMRVRGDYVDVFSDAPPKEAIDFAVQYSAFRNALESLLANDPNHRLPTTVLLFRNGHEFRRLFQRAGTKNPVAVSTDVDGAALVGLSIAGNRQEAFEMAFEFETAWGMRRMGYFVPLWASQGTGKVFATMTTKNGVTRIGRIPEGIADTWARQPVSWPRFFDIGADSREYTDPRIGHVYHRQALVLMHWFWLGEPGGQKRFKELAAKLRTSSGTDAIEAVSGVSAKELTSRILQHLRGRRETLEIPFDESALRTALKLAPAQPASVHVHLAGLLYSIRAEVEGDRELLLAQNLAPEMPAVKEARARREFMRGESARGLELYREAIEAGSTNPRAYLLSAEEWLQSGSGLDRAGGGGVFAEKAIADIRRALELSPGFPGAYALLGRAFYLRPEIGNEHVEELQAGLGLTDDGLHVRFYRAMLLWRLKRNAEYRDELRALHEAPEASPDVRRAAARGLETVAFEELKTTCEALVAKGEFNEARSAVKAAQANPGEHRNQDAHERLLAWVEQQADRAGSVK